MKRTYNVILEIDDEILFEGKIHGRHMLNRVARMFQEVEACQQKAMWVDKKAYDEYEFKFVDAK